MHTKSRDEFWAIEFILNSKKQTFDLRDIFSRWKFNGKIIEAKISNSIETIGNNQFLTIKK